jgi:hypothetical protein
MAFLLSAISAQPESSLTKCDFPKLGVSTTATKPFEQNDAIHKKTTWAGSKADQTNFAPAYYNCRL